MERGSRTTLHASINLWKILPSPFIVLVVGKTYFQLFSGTHADRVLDSKSVEICQPQCEIVILCSWTKSTFVNLTR